MRTGLTVDPVSLRAGVEEEGWLPEAAGAMAHLMACGTSREADSMAQALGRLLYSRSSFEWVGHAVGVMYGRQRPRVEEALAQALEVPAEVQSVIMPVVVLTDGSPEMMKLLDGALATHAPKATQVVALVNFCCSSSTRTPMLAGCSFRQLASNLQSSSPFQPSAS